MTAIRWCNFSSGKPPLRHAFHRRSPRRAAPYEIGAARRGLYQLQNEFCGWKARNRRSAQGITAKRCTGTSRIPAASRQSPSAGRCIAERNGEASVRIRSPRRTVSHLLYQVTPDSSVYSAAASVRRSGSSNGTSSRL